MLPNPDNFIKKKNCVIGIPVVFSIIPLAALLLVLSFFRGGDFCLEDISPEGTARVESAYCFPAEIAHGPVRIY